MDILYSSIPYSFHIFIFAVSLCETLERQVPCLRDHTERSNYVWKRCSQEWSAWHRLSLSKEPTQKSAWNMLNSVPSASCMHAEDAFDIWGRRLSDAFCRKYPEVKIRTETTNTGWLDQLLILSEETQGWEIPETKLGTKLDRLHHTFKTPLETALS